MIYLHCNDFEEFGYNGPSCINHPNSPGDHVMSLIHHGTWVGALDVCFDCFKESEDWPVVQAFIDLQKRMVAEFQSQN